MDLLAAALACRNGKKPSPKTHFPIYKWEDFLRRTEDIEKEQWLTQAEIAKIKDLRPYYGGDRLLYTLHQLDIMRKHERLIRAKPLIKEFGYFAHVFDGTRVYERLDNKTILARCPAGTSLPIAQGNHSITAEIVFYEPTLELLDEKGHRYLHLTSAT